MKLSELKVKIYADGADLDGIFRVKDNPLVKGFTTNPTLMRRSGVTDYQGFAADVLSVIRDKPISFEVFADDRAEMARQAIKMSEWASNVYVKIPIMDTKGNPNYELIRELQKCYVKVNVTAVMGLWQISEVIPFLNPNGYSIISVFAGRVADTGIHAREFMFSAVDKMKHANRPGTEILWASVREPLNIYEANEAGCNIVTVPEEILKKAIAMNDRDLSEVCRETVQMFHDDAKASGYTL